MGLRFRKSFGKGPFRVNASKSGVGYSVGGKGFRVTKKADGGMRTTASIPGTGVSYVKDYSDKKPASVSINATEGNDFPFSSFAAPGENDSYSPNVCRFCSKSLPLNAEYCTNCGKSQKTGRKKQNLSWLWAVLLIALLANFCSPKSQNGGKLREKDIAQAIEIVESAVSSVFTHCDVSYKDKVISAILWMDGLAPVTDKAIAGNDASLSAWNGLVASLEDFSLNITNDIKSAGIDDISVVLILVDDRDTNKVLVAASGGVSTLDCVALSEKPSSNSSVNNDTPTFSRSGSGSGSSQSSERKITYILNTKTKKFHQSFCDDVDEIKSSNKSTYTGTRAEVIAKGYSPCGHCDP